MWLPQGVLIALTLFPIGWSQQQPTIDVKTKYGTVRGYEKPISQDASNQVNVFLGVPYATAPTNDTRFLKAAPAQNYNGTKDALTLGNQCYYTGIETKDYSIDCLYLNIFAPTRSSNSPLLPVLFFIHGTDDVSHSSNTHGKQVANILPELHRILVVTFNYRQGILGFYTDGDKTAPGNQGLWDISQALKWVYENVENFGGDRKRITVGGHGTGSMAAELISLSPVTKDYVNQLLLMSGTNDYQWEPKDPSEVFNSVLQMANDNLGFTSDSSGLTDFLKKKDINQLNTGYSKDNVGYKVRDGPTYDGNFLPDTVSRLRARVPKVPTMIGFTKYEAKKFVVDDEYYESAARFMTVFVMNRTSVDDKSTAKGKPILDEFYDNGRDNSTLAYKRSYLELMTDVYTTNGIHRFAQDFVATSEAPLYVYRFDRFHSKFDADRVEGGSINGDDLPFVIGQASITDYTGRDKDVRKQFSKLIADFIQFGNPNGTSGVAVEREAWKPVDKQGKMNHLIYDYYLNRMNDEWFEDRYSKWVGIRERYGSASSIAVGMTTILMAACYYAFVF
ncbi:unnamed protein product [Bursaphelenchus xylophilus]|uniref:(pine wood nematode) hypothetical protein n=1 Tax=Bursaphelenchus xylophilus TaxID=6326 RepID=A0A1I7S629_BURXY|nr:unnamed protein product [Bursaphelenchus xylophilus]CAG9082336.1 unnamed protein product [Bursaphelenchus xylophilus]